jgi:hypothetical protein
MNPVKTQTSGPAEGDGEPKPCARKPYEKPRFAREPLFETMALACGETNRGIGQCGHVKKNS